jgi:hypothetical protein
MPGGASGTEGGGSASRILSTIRPASVSSGRFDTE